MISFVGARMDGEKRTNVESDGERERRKEAERRDKRLIDGATFGVGDVTDLVRECGAVIRERGECDNIGNGSRGTGGSTRADVGWRNRGRHFGVV